MLGCLLDFVPQRVQLCVRGMEMRVCGHERNPKFNKSVLNLTTSSFCEG